MINYKISPEDLLRKDPELKGLTSAYLGLTPLVQPESLNSEENQVIKDYQTLARRYF